jgi:alpha-beta hydrolase superfamily lysophospholipase
VTRTSSVFESDGAQLFEQCWQPADSSPTAAMVIVHGIKDHSSRYHDLAVELVAAGYAVCGFDHRGHGRSSGPRFAIHSFAQVMDDIDRYLAMVRERFAGAPIALFGHSMGAAMVPLYAIDRQPQLAGIILSATALRPHIHPFEIAGLRLTAGLFPNAPLLDAPDEDFSPDPAVVQDMRDDPFIHHGRGTGRMGVELVSAVERVWAHADEIALPILIMHGTADKATNPRGSVELHARVSSPDKTLALIPDAGHDLAHDPKRADVVRAIRTWLDEKLTHAGSTGHAKM